MTHVSHNKRATDGIRSLANKWISQFAWATWHWHLSTLLLYFSSLVTQNRNNSSFSFLSLPLWIQWIWLLHLSKPLLRFRHISPWKRLHIFTENKQVTKRRDFMWMTMQAQAILSTIQIEPLVNNYDINLLQHR